LVLLVEFGVHSLFVQDGMLSDLLVIVGRSSEDRVKSDGDPCGVCIFLSGKSMSGINPIFRAPSYDNEEVTPDGLWTTWLRDRMVPSFSSLGKKNHDRSREKDREKTRKRT
jgi:hypothetical protein